MFIRQDNVMKTIFGTLAIAAASSLSFGSVQAQQNCKKIDVLKNVDAKIVPSLAGCEGVSSFFDPSKWSLLGVCFVSDGRIPAKIGGKSVELETYSAWVMPSTQAAPSPDLQQVITLYKVYDGSGSAPEAIHSLDVIHPLKNKEDLVFIGGTGRYSNATGTATLSYAADFDPNSPIQGLPVSIRFGRLKGRICSDAL